MARHDYEPPPALERWGWRFHHVGIPIRQPREGEQYLPEYGLVMREGRAG